MPRVDPWHQAKERRRKSKVKKGKLEAQRSGPGERTWSCVVVAEVAWLPSTLSQSESISFLGNHSLDWPVTEAAKLATHRMAILLHIAHIKMWMPEGLMLLRLTRFLDMVWRPAHIRHEHSAWRLAVGPFTSPPGLPVIIPFTHTAVSETFTPINLKNLEIGIGIGKFSTINSEESQVGKFTISKEMIGVGIGISTKT